MAWYLVGLLLGFVIGWCCGRLYALAAAYPLPAAPARQEVDTHA